MGGRYEGFRMGVGFDLVYGIYRLMDPLEIIFVLVMLYLVVTLRTLRMAFSSIAWSSSEHNLPS